MALRRGALPSGVAGLRLVVVQGPGQGAQLVLDGKPVVEIGRSPTADLTLPDPQVAGIHLKVYRGDGLHLACFDVTGYGFGHNDQRVLKAELRPGDTLRLGSHVIRVITDSTQEVPTVAPQPLAAQMPAPPTATGALRVVRGNDAGKTFPLGEKSVVVLGRGEAADITIWDIRASRAHCRIDRIDGGFRLSDLNSSNGTFVNGKKVTSHLLQSGDLIKIGASVLQFAALRPA